MLTISQLPPNTSSNTTAVVLVSHSRRISCNVLVSQHLSVTTWGRRIDKTDCRERSEKAFRGPRLALCPGPPHPITASPSLPVLTLSQQLWIQNPPEEGIHAPTHPHSSLLLNNATPHTDCIAGRPPAHTETDRLYCMCAGV